MMRKLKSTSFPHNPFKSRESWFFLNLPQQSHSTNGYHHQLSDIVAYKGNKKNKGTCYCGHTVLCLCSFDRIPACGQRRFVGYLLASYYRQGQIFISSTSAHLSRRCFQWFILRGTGDLE